MSNNKIVHQVTKEYMKKNKKRTVTTLLGIVFMVMLMTTVFVGKDTAVRYLEKLASLERGSWHISVYNVTDEEYEQICKMEDVEQIGISSNLGYTVFKQGTNENRPYIQIKSYSEPAFELHRINIVEGRLPQAENEIVLNIETIEDGAEIQIGDIIEAELVKRYIGKQADSETTTMFPGGFTVAPGQCLEAPSGFPYYGENDSFYETLEFTGTIATYEIVGFIEKPSFEKEDAAAYTAITYNNGLQIAGDEKNVSIRFDLKSNGDYDTDVQRIVGTDCEMEYNTILLTFTANAKDSTMNGIVIFMSVFFVVLIVAASVVLIYNVFNMSFNERTTYLGMLSSVGATGKQKRSSVYYEAFSLLVVALPVGFMLGLLVVKLGMWALKPHIDTLLGMYAGTSIDRVPLEISFIGVILTTLLSVVTVWISANLPARKIGKIGPIESIKGNTNKSTKKRSINKMAIRMFGAEGMLAANSVSREKKKTRGLIGAAAIFMIVLIVTSYSTKALTTIVNYAMSEDGTIQVEIESDFLATIPMNSRDQAEYEKLKERVLNDKSVASCIEYYNGTFLGRGDKRILSREYLEAYTGIMEAYGISKEEQEQHINNLQPHVNFIGIDDALLSEIVKTSGADQDIMYDENVRPVIIVQNGEMSTENTSFAGSKEPDFKFYEIEKMSDVKVGETIEVNVLNGMTHEYEGVPVSVAGYVTNNLLEKYFTFHSNMIWLVTDLETVQELVDMEQCGEMSELHNYSKELYIQFDDKSSQLYSDLNSMHYDTISKDVWGGLVVVSSSIYDTETITGAINAVIEIVLKCFAVLTSLICMMNLYNSTKGRITGRRKELAILRSMGMTEVQMQKMLLLEAVSILLRSVLIAVLVATPVIAGISVVLERLLGTVNLGSPVGVYLLAVGIAALALVLVTIYTHNKERSVNILEDIRRESI